MLHEERQAVKTVVKDFQKDGPAAMNKYGFSNNTGATGTQGEQEPDNAGTTGTQGRSDTSDEKNNEGE